MRRDIWVDLQTRQATSVVYLEASISVSCWSSTPIEMYFCMFSSAVLVQLVSSIWQAFHDGMGRVATNISAITFWLISSVHPPDDAPPVLIIGSCSCAETTLLSLLLPGGLSRMKEPEVLLNTWPVEIQSCQRISRGMSGVTGWKGWNPRTRFSWMMNREGNGTWRSLMSRAIAFPWN